MANLQEVIFWALMLSSTEPRDVFCYERVFQDQTHQFIECCSV